MALNRRILVVDDNATIHEDFRKILRANSSSASEMDEADAMLFGDTPKTFSALSFEIDSAYQGQEGLALVRNAVEAGKPYAMAFIDVRMPPGWDGIETTAQIWKADPDLQVVICTAFSDYSWDEMLRELGQSDKLLILKKPFDNIEVLQFANALTEKWHLFQQTKNHVAQLEQKVQERTRDLLATNKRLEAEVMERKQTEEALRQSQQMVLQQERLAVVGQLAAGIAHEFNNILTIIQGHSTLLLTDSTLPPGIADPLRDIVAGTERAAGLTRQMLAFSRKQVMQSRPLNLGETVSRVTKMLESLLGANIVMRAEFAANLPCVWADPAMMEQVIVNLAVNARDAMPRGGELIFKTALVEISDAEAKQNAEARSGKFVCLTAMDTGCGMDESTLKRIFEPFFTTKDVGKGTGLGLSTVYGIVKQHEGWIEVTSTPGKGSTFKIFLPPTERKMEMPTAGQRLTPVAGGQETILVVEDEITLRRVFCAVLRKQGYQVLEAGSGVEALRIWQQHPGKIDLLLTDMIMPEGISGRELGEKLQKENPRLPVIYTSGYNEEMLGAADWANSIQFLAKPYHPAELTKTIRDCLDSAKGLAGKATSP